MVLPNADIIPDVRITGSLLNARFARTVPIGARRSAAGQLLETLAATPRRTGEP